MAFTRRIFTKEFRLNAAKLVVDEHRPAVDVARELDINLELGRGRGISNLDKKARITRPAPLI